MQRIKAILAAILMVASAQAQSWSGILSPSRAIDWQALNPGANTGIMNEARTQCGSTINPSGLSDGTDAAAINTAIAGCAAHKFVKLGPGVFSIVGGINFGSATTPVNNVTLRGSGPMSTIVKFISPSNTTGCGFSDVCILNNSGIAGYSSADADVQVGGSNSYDVTPASMTQGSTAITLDRTAGLIVGDSLILDQPNDEFGIADSPSGASEVGTTVTINTLRPHGFSVGQRVFVDAPGNVDIDNAVDTAGVVTVTTNLPHVFQVGKSVCIFNSGTSAYNGRQIVTGVTTNTFTFSAASGLASSTAGTADSCYGNHNSLQVYTIGSTPTTTSFTYTSEYPADTLAASGHTPNNFASTATVDLGEMMVCQTGGLCRAAAGGYGSQGRLDGGAYRSQIQIVQITNIVGNVVSISPAIFRDNWGTHGKTVANTRSPGAWYRGPSVVGDGIENMTLDHSGSTALVYGIRFIGARDCWVRNIRSINSVTAHVQMFMSYHNTVASSYFYGTTTAGIGAYGYEGRLETLNLVINNIFHHLPSPTILGSTTGTVIAYNYGFDNFYNSAGWMVPGLKVHDTGDAYTLYEGNQMAGFKADYIHGMHALPTLFRNALSGRETNLYNGPTPASTVTGTYPINLISASGRYTNIVGNVMGTAGYHTKYETSTATTPGSVNTSIYVMGFGSTQDNCNFNYCDPLTPTTLLRWGNYDVLTGVRWDSTEVPSGLSLYANPVPADHALPRSLFLSGPPPFWKVLP